MFFRNNVEIEDFEKIVNVVCGLWNRITENPLKWKEVLCHRGSPLYNLLEIEWSPVGSNKKLQKMIQYIVGRCFYRTLKVIVLIFLDDVKHQVSFV